MDPKLLTTLDMVLDDVIDLLTEQGWEDEAEWYDDLRKTLFGLDHGSAEFTELLGELERSFTGLGTFMDMPLTTKTSLASVREAVAPNLDNQHQQWGLSSCACGIIDQIKQAID